MTTQEIIFTRDGGGEAIIPSRFAQVLSQTALNGGQSYTQGWIDSTFTQFIHKNQNGIKLPGQASVQDVNFVSGSVLADQAGTLYLDQTDDPATVAGTASNYFSTLIPVSASTYTEFPLTNLKHQYYRFRYVNGATNQTSFLLAQVSERIDAFDQIQLAGSNPTDESSTAVIPNQLYDDASSKWNRQRGNTSGTLLASAARTASTSASAVTNYNAKGAFVYLNITAASGTGGLKLYFVAKNLNGVPTSISAQMPSTALTATGVYGFQIYPGANTSPYGNIQGTFPGPLPKQWYIIVVASDSSSYTYDVTYDLIN